MQFESQATQALQSVLGGGKRAGGKQKEQQIERKREGGVGWKSAGHGPTHLGCAPQTVRARGR